ncbi:phosphotransferase enzyme family protein [Hirsutella rhossiliensis]|uniref:Phosphotransferase enzyme family domain-containing protein n=1 Tax=Hirsutella rhossiliensis TaxID=111463 RepID=A0A9P8SGE5_9HYPO|nr:phosphotransferase enzyme family domain-containing protein [Hirsutella rhossiliensis]KAH0961953.1 phosphotransferase enzyme family domain-containing protein [Hirsutella rhossiliensis]
MAIFDELAGRQRQDMSKKWIHRAFAAQKEILELVAQRRSGGEPRGIVGWIAGSFNFCFRVAFTEGPDAVIRFPKPGCTVFADEKVINEARVIEFIRENTTIPVPRLISWGLTKDIPQQLGPFLISDFIHGVSLSRALRDPADNDWLFLKPALDNKTLNGVYEQIADILLQLFQFNFSKTQRNIATDQTTAKELYLARRRFLQLVDKYCAADDDQGPFKLFCDDLRPHNILVDPETLRITAVIDLEFTNAMPSQFSSDPPWWLLLAEPESYLSLGRHPEEFVTAYEASLGRFLQVLQRAEKARGLQLSSRMRDAWETKRFWFNYAIRNPFEIEILYENYLGEASGAGESLLYNKVRAEMEQFVQ